MSRAVQPRPHHLVVRASPLRRSPAARRVRHAEETTTFGDTEGVYVDVGPITYQVQISRQLNPSDVEDRDYLQGLHGRRGAADEVWFGVWMRVQNRSEHGAGNDDFEITDTHGNATGRSRSRARTRSPTGTVRSPRAS